MLEAKEFRLAIPIVQDWILSQDLHHFAHYLRRSKPNLGKKGPSAVSSARCVPARVADRRS